MIKALPRQPWETDAAYRSRLAAWDAPKKKAPGCNPALTTTATPNKENELSEVSVPAITDIELEYVIEQPLNQGVPTNWQQVTIPSSVTKNSLFLDNEDGEWRMWPGDMPEDTALTVETTRQFANELVRAAQLAERLNVEASGRRFEIIRGGCTSYKHKGHYHLIDELVPDGTTRRYADPAPIGRDHPADTAAPGDEWTFPKNKKEDIDRDYHFRYVGLFDLLRVTYDPADGTRIAAFVEVTGATKAVYDVHVKLGHLTLDEVGPAELERIAERNGSSREVQ